MSERLPSGIAKLTTLADQLCSQPAITRDEFRQFCWSAVRLAHRYPHHRADIAYLGCGVHSYLPKSQQNIYSELIGDGFCNLELPDAHVDKHLGTVDEQWEELESYIDKLG